MTDKLKSVLLIESRRITIVRKRGRTIAAWYEQQITLSPPNPLREHPAKKQHAWLDVCWRVVTLKSAAIFGPLACRFKSGGNSEGPQ
ncbi:MAG: hypothetical protein LC754_11550 [Acidobacteria bacterium]|nr:hypothetical protein [Acidobacteriota bacterium]